MSKNIVKIILGRKMNIEENVIDNIMDFHGDIDKMLPEGYFPKSIKNCLKIDNWRLLWKSEKENRETIYHLNIIIDIDIKKIWKVFNDEINVSYRYPTINGPMKGEGKIESIVCGVIKFKNSKYNFKLDKFEYIVIKHSYKKLYPEKIHIPAEIAYDYEDL